MKILQILQWIKGLFKKEQDGLIQFLPPSTTITAKNVSGGCLPAGSIVAWHSKPAQPIGVVLDDTPPKGKAEMCIQGIFAPLTSVTSYKRLKPRKGGPNVKRHRKTQKNKNRKRTRKGKQHKY